MKIIDYIRKTNNLDLISNLMVYPDLDTSRWPSWTVWRCRTIDGKDLDGCYEFDKDTAIKKAKEYLNSEIINFNGVI